MCLKNDRVQMQRTITLKNLSPDHSAVFKVLTQKRSQHLYVVRPTAVRDVTHSSGAAVFDTVIGLYACLWLTVDLPLAICYMAVQGYIPPSGIVDVNIVLVGKCVTMRVTGCHKLKVP